MNSVQKDDDDRVLFNQKQFAFLRMMGHELRTPLNSIVATSEMLTDGIYGELQPGQVKATQRVFRNSRRLLTLINAVMLYIRAESNALEMRRDTIQPRVLFTALIEQFREHARAKGLEIALQISGDAPASVICDTEHLTFVLSELLNNAISYAPSGQITVEISGVADESWRLTVSDHGPGIPPEVMAELFVPFARGPEAKKDAPEGNGMGLPIVREIAGIMKGSIEIQSEPGKGTRATVTLPRNIHELKG